MWNNCTSDKRKLCEWNAPDDTFEHYKKKILDTCGLATVYCGSTKLRHENMRV